MKKFRIFVNIDKEEAWINSVIAQGYRLKHVSSLGQYVFEKLPSGSGMDNSHTETAQTAPHPEEQETEPFLPLVRMDFRTFSKKEDFINYLTLFEDYGWHHVAGKKSEGNQYFERMRPDCQEEIFSDSPSKAARYRRISSMWMMLFAAYLPLLIIYWNNFHLSSLTDWKELFYTPGLWELSGAKFCLAFLFELPFALGRAIGGFFPLVLLVITICYAYFSLQTLYWYRKEKK